MPIRKPTNKLRKVSVGQKIGSEALLDLAGLMAEFVTRLQEALQLLDGIACLSSTETQVARVVEALEESVLWFSDYFAGNITEATLVMSLKRHGAPALRAALEGLGKPESGADEDELLGPISELDERTTVRASSTSHQMYPPGVTSSILDDESTTPDEWETDAEGKNQEPCSGLKQDIALLSERLVEQLRLPGLNLHRAFALIGD